MDDEFQQFIARMAEGADATTHELEEEEKRLRVAVGPERAAELEQLWARQLDPIDEEEFKRYMDWTDKKLIWIWRQIAISRERRFIAGRAAMKRNPILDKD
jgi:hypothetical protein